MSLKGKEEFYPSILSEKLLDPAYQKAKNKDFEVFPEEIYVKILDFIHEITSEGNNIEAVTENELIENIRRKIAKKTAINADFSFSALIDWINSYLKEFADVQDENPNDVHLKKGNDTVIMFSSRTINKIKYLLQEEKSRGINWVLKEMAIICAKDKNNMNLSDAIKIIYSLSTFTDLTDLKKSTDVISIFTNLGEVLKHSEDSITLMDLTRFDKVLRKIGIAREYFLIGLLSRFKADEKELRLSFVIRLMETVQEICPEGLTPDILSHLTRITGKCEINEQTRQYINYTVMARILKNLRDHEQNPQINVFMDKVAVKMIDAEIQLDAQEILNLLSHCVYLPKERITWNFSQLIGKSVQEEDKEPLCDFINNFLDILSRIKDETLKEQFLMDLGMKILKDKDRKFSKEEFISITKGLKKTIGRKRSRDENMGIHCFSGILAIEFDNFNGSESTVKFEAEDFTKLFSNLEVLGKSVNRKLIVAVGHKLLHDKPVFRADEITKIFTSLKRLTFRNVPGMLIKVLMDIIQEQRIVLNNYQLAESIKILLALKPSAVPDNFFDVISDQIENSKNPYDTYSISTFFYVLKRINSKRVTRRYFELIKRLLYRNCDIMKGNEIKRILSGLQSLDKTLVNEDLFNILSSRIFQLREFLDDRSHAKILHGIRNFDTEVISRDFVDMLTEKTEQHSTFNSYESGCIIGLQGLDERVVTNEYFDKLVEKIIRSPEVPDLYAIAGGLTGIHKLGKLKGYKKLVEYFIRQLNRYRDCEIEEKEVVSIMSALKLNRIKPPRWFIIKYEKTVNEIEKRPPTLTETEKTSKDYLETKFPGLEIIPGKIIDGFEMDLFIPKHNINIEIDGEYHLIGQISDKNRDLYLINEKKIAILRINLLNCRNNDEVHHILIEKLLKYLSL